MNMRPGSEREMAAVTFNHKEQRCLERSIKTIQMEYSYQVKLINLDHRVIKVNYKKLKDKVTKIKSYLTADEIHSLRKLDSAGKLKPMCNSVNFGGTLKIAAAAKRLKCFPSGRDIEHRVVSADPRLCGHGGQKYPQTSTPITRNVRRCNSVAGVFMDAPILNKACNTRHRHVSADFESRKPTLSRPGTCATGYTPQHSHPPFSSHTAAEKDASRKGSDSSRAPREAKAFLSDSSIDNNLGDDLYEERRQELLEEELSKTAELENRKNEFLKSVDHFLNVNPQNILKAFRRVPESIAVHNDSNRRILAHRVREADVDRTPGPVDRTPTHESEEEYRNKMLHVWTDIDKCRYLRIPDELIDLSGITTLATEQIRLCNTLKTAGEKTFAASAEV